MASKDVVAGVGARYAEAFRIDNNTGLPGAAFNSGTLTGGTLIDRLKGFTYNSPAPQAFTHYGDDNPFAKDSLPPTEIGNFTIITAQSNLTLDAFSEGTKEVTLDTVVHARAGNTNNRGSEPQNFLNVFRQALDTQRGSSTFGKLRQWHAALVPSCRIINQIQSMEQGITNKTYEGIPTPVTSTPWAATFDVATWGGTQAEYVELTFDYKPVWAFGLGNGTLTVFALPKPPIDTAHTHAWVNGTLATVSSVNTSTTAPTMTLSAAPGGNGSGGLGTNNAAFIAVCIEHNQPS
jgi:hypothetical protein